MKKLKRIGTAAFVIATVSAGAVMAGGPASASVVKGICTTYRSPFCLYYNSSAYGYGAEFGAYEDIPSFNPAYGTGDTYEFEAGAQGSAGAGWSVWNQVAAAWDYDFDYSFTIYANHGYAGASETIAAGGGHKDLTVTHNNDTSLKWG